MHEAVSPEVTSGGSTTQRLWLLHQPRRHRYRARAKSAAARAEQNHLQLTSLEQNREYRRLIARLVRLSESFQQSLTAEQRRTWLTLEDALLDHAWFLHAHYFKAGYEVGKATTRRRPTAYRPPGSGSNQLREQAVLLSALAKLLERLVDVGPARERPMPRGFGLDR
jgi:hypothetical protein